jgi:putative zinc finger/helix-turn-helix YgiT family protein
MEEEAMKCEDCGAAMKVGRENYKHDSLGLDRLVLKGVEVRRCPSCGYHEVVIPNLEGLLKTLAQTIAQQRARLTPNEVRFLRKYLGFSGADFARAAGTSSVTVSRWESGARKMDASSERMLRLMVLVRDPVINYDLTSLADVAKVDLADVSVRAKHMDKGWSAEVAA